MPVFLAWLAWSILNGFIARERGRDPAKAVWVSLLVSPLLYLVYLVATPSRTGINAWRPAARKGGAPKSIQWADQAEFDRVRGATKDDEKGR